MKRVIKASASATHTSGCSFDFDLGDNYSSAYVEDAISEIFDNFGMEVIGIDFRSVDYPGGKQYSQCGVDFKWSGDTYDADAVEEEIASFIDDEGGNFFGIDFYSMEDVYSAEDIEDEDNDEWTPYGGYTYLVSSDYKTKRTNSPREAIEFWFKFQKRDPMGVSISCAKREEAVELCKYANIDFLSSLADKYPGCPYRIDWLADEASKKVADGQKYFYEGKYGYGDVIHPFGPG